MSSYIQVELDALKKAPLIAVSAKIGHEWVTHGLVQMWAYAYGDKAEVITDDHLAGFFGSVLVAGPLVAFGFLERVKDGYRIRGAGRYRRISEVRSLAGKKGRGKQLAADGGGSGGGSAGKRGQLPSKSPAIAQQTTGKQVENDALPGQKRALEPIADSSLPTGENIINARMNTCAGGDPEPALGAPAGSPCEGSVEAAPASRILVARPPGPDEPLDEFLERYPWPADVMGQVDAFAMQALSKYCLRTKQKPRLLREALTIRQHGARAILGEQIPPDEQSQPPPPKVRKTLEQVFDEFGGPLH